MKVQNQILINLNKEPLEERSSWKRISGPRVKYMDEKYQDLLKYKLIPILNAYDIDISDRAYDQGPGKQTYMGYDKDGNRILFVFNNANVKMDPYDTKRWTMFLTILYKGKAVDVGMIDLKNTDDLNRSFSLITQNLEDMGFKLEGEEDLPKDTEEENDSDIKTLIDYKNSLSESERKELDKELLGE